MDEKKLKNVSKDTKKQWKYLQGLNKRLTRLELQVNPNPYREEDQGILEPPKGGTLPDNNFRSSSTRVGIIPGFVPVVHEEIKIIPDEEPVLKFFKVRDVKSPERGTPQSAGIDFFIPTHAALASMDMLQFDHRLWSTQCYTHTNEATGEKFSRPYIKIDPFGSALIPSGIKVEIPKGFALIAFNKSGVATKKGLTVGACVVDEDYQGEVHIHLINQTDKAVFLQPGEKIVQFVLVPMAYIGLEEVYEIHQEETERGQGGFGSTGNS